MEVLRGYARFVAVAASACAALLGFFLIVEAVLIVGGWNAPSFWTIRRLSMIPYTLAVCGIAWGAWAVSRGITLWAALPRLLGLVGVLLAVGGFLDLTGTSLISRILWPETYQSIGYFDPSYFAVTIVGMMLWLVGRLTARAFAKARELEEFV